MAIEQPIQSAQSVQFKNETEFTIIDVYGESYDIPIKTTQKTTLEKVAQQTKDISSSTVTMAKQAVSAMFKGKTETIPALAQNNAQPIQSSYTINFPKIEELKQINEEDDDDDAFFESITAQAIHDFKTNISTDSVKTNKAFQDIIKEISQTSDAESFEAQSDLIEYYNHLPQQIKQIFARDFFQHPFGWIYDQQDKDEANKSEWKNNSGSVNVKIKYPLITITNNNRISTGHILDNPLTIFISDSGKYIAVLYPQKSSSNIVNLDIFYQINDTQYSKATYFIDSSEIIGLRFVNDATLFLLNADYIMTSFDLKTIQYYENIQHYKANKKAQFILKEIEELSEEMKTADVNSPETIIHLYEKINELDTLVPLLGEKEKNLINEKQELLKERYLPTYSRVMENSLSANWLAHKDTLITIATNIIIPTLSIAVLPTLQAITGNAPLDFSSLSISAFTAIAATNIGYIHNHQLYPTTSALITGAGSAAFQESLTAYKSQPLTIPYPTAPTVLKGAFMTTAALIAKNALEKEGGVQKILQEFSAPLILRKAQLTEHNEITNAIIPAIKKIITKPEIASFLAEITYVSCQYACIGMGMHLMGLGFSNETDLTTALTFSAIRGVTYGAMSEVLKKTTNTTGAAITLPTNLVTSTLTSSFIKNIPTTLTPQEATASLLQGVAIAAADLIIEKSGTFKNLVHLTSEKLKAGLPSMQNFYNLWNVEQPRFF